MYDELVKSIHCCFGFDSMQTDCENCMMKDKREEHNYVGCCDALGLAAANAIEELQKIIEQYKLYLQDSIKDLKKAHTKEPKWIPVTERLPEAESGNASKPVLVTDGDCMAIAEWFNFELCEPYWSYTGIGDITHWQPLPEPPKEE